MSLFAGLLDRRIALAEAAIADEPAEIMEEEEPAVARAVPRRRREFAAGRACARRALAALGVPAVAIPAGPDRMPLWPAGYVGSITHTERHAAAAVGRVGDGLRSVGIDLEPAEALPADLYEMICRPEELAWLDARGDARGVLGRALFGAKECAFKCLYPITLRMLEFHDVSVTLDPEQGTFAATFLTEGDLAAQGRMRITADFVACAMVWDGEN